VISFASDFGSQEQFQQNWNEGSFYQQACEYDYFAGRLEEYFVREFLPSHEFDQEQFQKPHDQYQASSSACNNFRSLVGVLLRFPVFRHC